MTLPYTSSDSSSQDINSSIQIIQASRPTLLKKIVIFGGAGLGVVLAVGGVIAWATDSASTDSAANTSTGGISKLISRCTGPVSVITKSSRSVLSWAIGKKTIISGVACSLLIIVVVAVILAVFLPPLLSHNSGHPQAILSPENRPDEHSQPNPPTLESKNESMLYIGLGVGISLFMIVLAAIVIILFVYHKQKQEIAAPEQQSLASNQEYILFERNRLAQNRIDVKEIYDIMVAITDKTCKVSATSEADYINHVVVNDATNNPVYSVYCKSPFSKANITRAIKYYKEESLGQPYEPMVILSGELESKSENTLTVTEYDHATLNMEQCDDIRSKLGNCYFIEMV
jgi:hypothetical protein